MRSLCTRPRVVITDRAEQVRQQLGGEYQRRLSTENGRLCPCPVLDACTTLTLPRAPGADRTNLFSGASDGYFQEPAGASQFGDLYVPGRLSRSSLHHRSDARRRRCSFFVVGRRRACDRFPGSRDPLPIAFRSAGCPSHPTKTRRAHAGTESSQTRCWSGMDSNFQYAGAVNLIVAPLRSPATSRQPAT